MKYRSKEIEDNTNVDILFIAQDTFIGYTVHS